MKILYSFKDLSKGYPNEWLWSFTPKEGGEIITSTEQNPQMMFSPGIYTVKLVAKNPKDDLLISNGGYITVIDKNCDCRRFWSTMPEYICRRIYFTF